MNNLEGHAVVITGAGGGLGAAYAKAAAGLGARIVVNDINRDAAENIAAEIRQANGAAVAETQDVRYPEAAEALVQRCVREFGEIGRAHV